jgi:metallo-beta-lactamase family protein
MLAMVKTTSSIFTTDIKHHGAVNGVTGSCHELVVSDSSNHVNCYLLDCGLFQEAETSGRSVNDLLAINFDIANLRSLVVTHCHIDHVGRIPYLLAAGSQGLFIALVRLRCYCRW